MSRPGKRCRRKCPDSAEAELAQFNELEYAGFLSPLDHASMRRPPFKTMPNSPLPLKRRRSGWSGSASQTRDERLGKVCVNEWKPQFASMSSMTAAPPGRSAPQARSSSKRTLRSLCKLSCRKRSICPSSCSSPGRCLLLDPRMYDHRSRRRSSTAAPTCRWSSDWWAEDRCSRDDPCRCAPSLQE